MIRIWLMVLLVSCLILACHSTRQPATIKLSLNGAWRPVNQEMNGKPMPKSFYEHQQLVIDDSSYTLISESVDRGSLRISGNRIDIFGREGVNKGRHFTALFHLEGKTLRICYNLKGDSYPESFSTLGRQGYFLSVFERIE